jgi:NADPH:quinone reductase-like Zn-dependent oxidoreductase
VPNVALVVHPDVDYAVVEGFYFYAPWNDDNLVTNHHAQLFDSADNPHARWGYSNSVNNGVSALVDAGEISVQLERTFPLEKAPEALEESRNGHVRGKIVLLVD